jgi:hypothetical protein
MMQRFTLLSFFLLVGILIGCSSTNSALAEKEAPALPEFNQIVLKIAKSYPTDGTHDYWWPKAGEGNYDGCSTDLFLNDQKVMKGEENKRTFCCGYTLEVFLKAYNEYLVLHKGEVEEKLTPENFKKFKGFWYVKDVNGPGPSAALEQFGLGKTITRDEVLPGDFVQIWRRWDKEKKKNGSGHSVIFLEWVKDEAGKVTGFKYISTQKSTTGIGERVEMFGAPEESKGVAHEFTHWGRVEIPNKSKTE